MTVVRVSDLRNKKEDIGEDMFISGPEKVWSNDAVECIKLPIDAFVPYSIQLFMRNIERKLNSSVEFGAFLSGTFTQGQLHVSQEFLVLKQEVTAMTIDFLEDPPDKFNGVIHRHPGNMHSFSGTDSSSINQNHDFSLLYAGDEIKTGILNVHCGGVRIQLPLTVTIEHPDVEGVNGMVEKISKKEGLQHSSSTGGNCLSLPFSREELGENCGFSAEEHNDIKFEEEDDSVIAMCPACRNAQSVQILPEECEMCGADITSDDLVEEV